MSTTFVPKSQELNTLDQKFAGLTENEIVEIAKSGRPEAKDAFSWVYQKFQPQIFHYALKRTGNHQDSEDVTSEVFLRIFNNLENYQKRENIPLQAWVFKIAHNFLASWRKHANIETKNRSLFPADDLFEFISENGRTAGNIEDLLDIRRAIPRLPENYRQVLALRFSAGLSVANTAQIVKKTRVHTRVIQHKAIGKLREILQG